MGKRFYRCMMQNVGLKIIFLALLNGLFLPVYIFLRAPVSPLPRAPNLAPAYQARAAPASNTGLGQAVPSIIRESLDREAGQTRNLSDRPGLSGRALAGRGLAGTDPKAPDSVSSYTGASLRPTGLSMGVVTGRVSPPERERYRTRLCVSRTRNSGLSGSPAAYAPGAAPSKNASEITTDGFLPYAKRASATDAYDIGVYYFQEAGNKPPADAARKGLAPVVSNTPDEEPLLGSYEQGDVWAAESNIEWASLYGIDFFVYDWRWDGKKPYLDEGLRSYLGARNNDRLKFSLIWMNGSDILKSLKEFDAMIDHMGSNLLGLDRFYKLGFKPLLFVHSPETLDKGAKRLGSSGRELIERAQARVKAIGLKGIYFVAVTNRRPSVALGEEITRQGYSAYTWLDYPARDEYQGEYTAASISSSGRAEYLAYASPLADADGIAAERFEGALRGAKSLMDRRPGQRKMLMAGAWNRPVNGPYIEPAKSSDFKYLEAIDRVFGAPMARRKGRGV